jgi:tRNA-dependent cyclodipeptide synthase
MEGAAFETGYRVLQTGGLAIVGMSVRNSYFKKNRIDELLRYCATLFQKIRIMVPDKPAEHTYRALGQSPAKAERKARLSGNTLQNHSLRTMAAIHGEVPGFDIKLIEWGEEVSLHEAFEREYQNLKTLYSSNESFRKEIRDTTRSVLNGKSKPGYGLESAIDEGIHYLLKELAFLSASPEILGVDKIAYVYHHRWKVYEDFVSGKFDGIKRNNLGFVIVTQNGALTPFLFCRFTPLPKICVTCGHIS